MAARLNWLVLSVALMGGSLILRASAWYWILAAALPAVKVRLIDAIQGTLIGVMMSATLPAY